MIVVESLVVLFCLGAGTRLVRRGLRSWRAQAPAQNRSAVFTPKMKAGTERALLPLGVFVFFVGALIGTVGYLNATHHMGGAGQRPSLALAIVLLGLLGGTIFSSWTFIAVSALGRPRCLVPPHLRTPPAPIRRVRRG